jgi:hypothetical protein
MAVVNKRLDLWLHEQPDNAFPYSSGNDYKARLTLISNHLKKNVFSEGERMVLLKSLLSEKPSSGSIIYLNNHGSNHVDMVIDRASELLKSSNCDITPYEGYLLLVACYFHDVGIVLGRENHEDKARDIMQTLGKSAGNDEAEKRMILKIAAAHSGNFNGNKDKIEYLEPKPHLFGQRIRKRFLAAILRFADELADERSRASRFLLETNSISVVPGSELYHAYSFSLLSVITEGDTIHLRYEIDEPTALRKYKKKDSEIYLLDEIYERTIKMHLERVYCVRFLRPYIQIDKIEVRIEVYKKSEGIPDTAFEKIAYTISETGYPEWPLKGIYALTDKLTENSGKNRDGQWLVEKLTLGVQ